MSSSKLPLCVLDCNAQHWADKNHDVVDCFSALRVRQNIRALGRDPTGQFWFL